MSTAPEATAAAAEVVNMDETNVSANRGATFEKTEKETKEQDPLEEHIATDLAALAKTVPHTEKDAKDESKPAELTKDDETASTTVKNTEEVPSAEAPAPTITPDTSTDAPPTSAPSEPVAVESSSAAAESKRPPSTPSPDASSSSNPPSPPTDNADSGSIQNGQDVSDLDASTQQDSPSRTGRRSSHHHDDVDSSDDESSYFAKDMPSPKSRRFSFSSNASAAEIVRQDTDASLSLSDDSEAAEDSAGPYPASAGQQQQPLAVGDLQFYNERITRMHSASSLVSTSSQNSEELPGDYPGPSLSPIKSGRRSPIMGEHAPSRGQVYASFQSPSQHSSFNPGPSPPTILPVHPPVGSMPHPQPQAIMTPEQWTAWLAAGQQPPAVHPYAPGMDPQGLQSASSAWSASNEESLGYSDDNVDGNSSHNNMNQPVHPFPPAQDQRQPSVQKREKKRSSKDKRSSKNGHASRGGTDGLPVAPMDPEKHHGGKENGGFKVYWQRWIMLGYMSVLNLLSDWTCYSVAPIALLTEEAFGNINPEELVVVFLGANAVATACEPVILSRLGLKRTVVFGALLLMIGSVVKSGGMPPIIAAELEKGQGEWRVYVGFFLVGLSQPLYQCTPALLSASWFPESERTMATGVALNANQLGIGFAFIFGTLLVSNSDDIPKYFGLLSIISTCAFLGALFQFDDAPPTPPSDTAKVMRGTLETPNMRDVFQSMRGLGSSLSSRNFGTDPGDDPPPPDKGRDSKRRSSKRSSTGSGTSRRQSSSKKGQAATASSSSTKQRSGSSSTRRRSRSQPAAPKGGSDAGFHGLAPSPAPGLEPVSRDNTGDYAHAFHAASVPAPSSSMPGRGGSDPRGAGRPEAESDTNPDESSQYSQSQYSDAPAPPQGGMPPPVGPYAMGSYPPNMQYSNPEGMQQAPFGQMPYPPDGSMPMNAPFPGYPPYAYPNPYMDPRYQQFMQYQQFMLQQQQQQQDANFYPPPVAPYQYGYQNAQFPLPAYEPVQDILPAAGQIDRGAEPVLKMTPHHLDIEIEDDQIIRSTRACLSRPGFIHALVSFTVSGIVINTLSTFMDYLVRLNGAGREFTGIVGGSFQFVIMISSLIVGKLCDKTRAYYSIAVCMLVLGAFGLAQCGVDLDADKGTELRYALVVVAALVGPLQPVSTELGVDVVYPLSENTVLVIQQLFSNLLSALFIPCFKALKDVGLGEVNAAGEERPEYTFSFYLLIVLHAMATVFFATFNGRYIRYEHEIEKKEKEEERQLAARAAAFHPVQSNKGMVEHDDGVGNEQRPLLNPQQRLNSIV